jgi:hypothetical protein
MTFWFSWLVGLIGGFVFLGIYRIDHEWFAVLTGVFIFRLMFEIFNKE